MAKKERKTSAQRGRTTQKKRRSTRKKGRRGQAFNLGVFLQERWRELTAILLFTLGLLTIFSMAAPVQAKYTRAWVDLLGYVFGWGMYMVPVVLLGIGIWILLKLFVKRMPSLPWDRITGFVMLYLVVLVVFNVAIGAHDTPTGLEAAAEGRAGGFLGSFFYGSLIEAVGLAGTFIVLTTWFLIAGMLVLGITLPELLLFLGRIGRQLSTQFQRILPERKPFTPGAVDPVKTVLAEPVGVLPSAADALEPESGAETSAPVSAERSVRTSTSPFSALAKRDWQKPDIDKILEPGAEHKFDQDYNRSRAQLIEETLDAFGAPAHVVEINHGPAITQFGVEPAYLVSRGGKRIKVKVNKISSLADDLALALAAPSVRIQAPVPGKGFVGIEVPNPEISLVSLHGIMKSPQAKKVKSVLRIGLGSDVSGIPLVADLALMPHLLIAGTTGSGKSVCVNTIIASLLLQNSPNELRFVMIDPKRVELTFYNGIPHLLAPVIVNLDRVVASLQWVLREMDQRYQDFSREGVRNLIDYNQRMKQIKQDGKPYLVVVIDELADLMMMAADETERVITRLAQLARATGIHLIIATQRPSTDVVTGLIKANFPARIAFAVASSIDSRVILDQPGAERLLGRGDMLFNPPEAPAPVRLQGAFVSDEELEKLVRFWKNQMFDSDVTQPAQALPVTAIPDGAELKQVPLWEGAADFSEDNRDVIFDEAVQIVRQARKASISMLQRKMRIGYTRSARLIDQMEEDGIIGSAKGGSQPREVLDYGDLSAGGLEQGPDVNPEGQAE